MQTMKQQILCLILWWCGFAVHAVAQSTGLFTYDGGFFVKKGNAWSEYRPVRRAGVWATYTQYSEDADFYYVKNSSGSVCVPKKPANSFFIHRDGRWQVIYQTRQLYSYFDDPCLDLYCYEGGYFVRDGRFWREYRPGDKPDVWATYTQYGEDDNYFQIESSSCKVSVPKSTVNDFYLLQDGNWQKCYISTDIYLAGQGSVTQATGPRYSLIKLYCSDVEKKDVDLDDPLVTYDEDVLTLRISLDGTSPSVKASSEKFGDLGTISTPWLFKTEDREMKTADGETLNVLIEWFYNPKVGAGIIYTFPRSLRTKSLFQFIPEGDIYYDFNVKWAEVYDHGKEEWVRDYLLTTDPDEDVLRMKLRALIGRHCTGFTATPADNRRSDTDPWVTDGYTD